MEKSKSDEGRREEGLTRTSLSQGGGCRRSCSAIGCGYLLQNLWEEEEEREETLRSYELICCAA